MRLTDKIKNFDGSDFLVPAASGNGAEVMTIRVAVTQLLSQARLEQDDIAKYSMFCLARKIQDGDEVILDRADRKLIREQAGKLAIPLIMGHIWEALDEDDAVERAAEKAADKKA